DTSSTISFSRVGERFNPTSRFLISSLKSGMLDSCDAADRFHKLAPAIPLRRQRFLARRRQPIVTPPPLPRLLDPATPNPSPLFEAIQQRIKRSDVEMQSPVRA